MGQRFDLQYHSTIMLYRDFDYWPLNRWPLDGGSTVFHLVRYFLFYSFLLCVTPENNYTLRPELHVHTSYQMFWCLVSLSIFMSCVLF